MDITEEAKQELRRIIDKRDLDKDKRFRLTTPPVWEGEGDFGIVIDVERERDLVVEHEGVEILRIDPETAEHLSKAVMDFKESRFTLDVY